jgi:hypothetical protein
MGAHCDISTGKIYGCEEGTFNWYHEKAHLEFAESERGSTLHLYQKYALHAWMLFFTASYVAGYQVFLGSLLSLFTYFAIEMYEEFHCNNQAKIKLKEVNNGKERISEESSSESTDSSTGS